MDYHDHVLFPGSSYKVLHRKYGEPTKIMVVVVEIILHHQQPACGKYVCRLGPLDQMEGLF